MTPVVLLTDGYIANGSEPWKLPDLSKQFTSIKTRLVDSLGVEAEGYKAYERDNETLLELGQYQEWKVTSIELVDLKKL